MTVVKAAVNSITGIVGAGNSDGIPKHIIKRGKVKVEVRGRDETPPQIQWLQVSTNERVEARIYDGAGIGKVMLTFAPNEQKSTKRHVNWDDVPKGFSVELVDNGLNGDAIEGDGIYSRKIKDKPSYFYDLKIEMVDASGSGAKVDLTDAVF